MSKLFADEDRKVIALDADKITPLVKLSLRRLSLILSYGEQCPLYSIINFERLYIDLKELIKERTGLTSDEYDKFFKLNSTVDI